MCGALGAAPWHMPLPAQGADKRVPGKERLPTSRGWLRLTKPARDAHFKHYFQIPATRLPGIPSPGHHRKLGPVGWAARRCAAKLEFYMRKSGSRLE